MNHYIRSIQIENLFDEKNIVWKLNRVNVLVGKNGFGKSTILRLINSAITKKGTADIDLCNEINIQLRNNQEYHASRENISHENFKLLLEKFSNSEKFTSVIESAFSKYSQEKNIEPELISEVKKNFLLEIKNKNISFNSNSSKNGNISGFKFGVNTDKMNTEFISTVNMSANSVNNITKSTGEHTTLLDDEIEAELQRLNRNCKANPEMNLKIKLTVALNNFFNETSKIISIDEENIEVTLGNGKKLKYQSLSSGERQIIFIFLKVINGSVDSSLILMDEPEISLHLSWQEKLLDEITRVNESSQIIVVTHSPAILMNGWFDCLTDIKDIFVNKSDSVEVD